MEALPFRTAPRGYAHADVRAMLDEQMRLARVDPAAAIDTLDGIDFAETAPGVNAEEVREWMDAQRAWLHGRLHDPQAIQSALTALGCALDDLKRAVDVEARAAERRTADAAERAERRCQELIRDAERRIAKKAAQTRRAVREEAAQLRARALEDAERIVQQAGSHAAQVLLAADERDRAAAEAAAQVSAMNAELLNQIDAAQAAVRPPAGRRAA
jgi:hypothetical protein